MSKTGLRVIFCLVMVWLFLIQATTYAGGNVAGSFMVNAPGDSSGDGVIDASDVTYIEHAVAADQDHALNNGCDANEDGKVNALDITMIELMAT